MDIDQVRKETLNCQHRIHFNNAGASLVPDVVLDSYIDYLKEEQKYGGYEYGSLKSAELDSFYIQLAKLIHCQASEIAFTDSATRAWNMALYSIPFQPGDEVLICANEYGSNHLNYLHLQAVKKIKIVQVPSAPNGEIDLYQFENLISAKTKLISIVHMPTNGGVVNPIEEIGVLAKKHQVLYLVDACQSVGQFPINVQKIQCDFLSATGRKYMRGPRGTGFLYIAKNTLERVTPPQVDLKASRLLNDGSYTMENNARVFELWENNLAAKIAFAKAIEYINNIGIHAIWSRVQELSELLRAEIRKIPGFTVYDYGSCQSGIVSLAHHKISSVELKKYLNSKQVNCSTSSKESSLIDFELRNLPELLRLSVHYYNTKSEIQQVISYLKQL